MCSQGSSVAKTGSELGCELSSACTLRGQGEMLTPWFWGTSQHREMIFEPHNPPVPIPVFSLWVQAEHTVSGGKGWLIYQAEQRGAWCSPSLGSQTSHRQAGLLVGVQVTLSGHFSSAASSSSCC